MTSICEKKLPPPETSDTVAEFSAFNMDGYLFRTKSKLIILAIEILAIQLLAKQSDTKA